MKGHNVIFKDILKPRIFYFFLQKPPAANGVKLEKGKTRIYLVNSEIA